jgi:Restriction endonuclease
MLTPTDIHYLVGILATASTPDDVEIELGSMVNDIAAEKKRDVDVTVTYMDDDGSIRAFVGIEVKAHKRPLNVEQVEQLAAKLADMPTITHRSIVSASDYTKAARRKAKARGVELFHLKDSTDNMNAFDHVKFLPTADFTDWQVEWYEFEKAHFILPDEINADDYEHLMPVVCNAAGEIIAISIDELRDKIIQEALHAFIGYPEQSLRTADQPYPVDLIVDIPSDLHLSLGDLKVPINQMQIIGSIIWRKTIHRPTYKILVKEGEERPFVGGMVTISNNGEIFCVVASSSNRSIQVYAVPLADRNKKKIRQIKGHEPQPFRVAPLSSTEG